MREVCGMAVSLDVLVSHIENLLNVSEYIDVVKNGLQVEGERSVKTIATAVTPSLYVIEKAKKERADLLLTHHGLFLKNSLSSIEGVLKNRLAALFSSGIHLLSYHLPLDAHKELGNNFPQAADIGLTHLEGFYAVHGKTIGVKGILKKSTSATSLHKRLCRYWGKEGAMFGNQKQISTVAFLSGGGHRALEQAFYEKIDCLITGTADDAAWHIAQEIPITLMVFGHHVTEKAGVQLLGDHLRKKFSLHHFFIDEKNPL